MSKAVASEVILSENGLVVLGARGPNLRVWYRPAKTTRMHEYTLKFDAPRGSPAALTPKGKLLVVSGAGEALLIEAGRSPQPVPVLGQAIEGLSPQLVAFAKGPRFFRLVDGAWRDESPAGEPLEVAAVGDFAVGAGGACWLPGEPWKQVALKTKASLTCATGAWAGGKDVVLERAGKTFKVHKVKGTVTAICPWQKSALVVIDGAVKELSGTPVKAPGRITSIAAHGEALACIANGSLLESTFPLRRWNRTSLPKLARK